MANFDGKFDSSKQDWETPDEMFAKLDAVFHFDFDLAASKENTKCASFFSIDDNALERVWHGVCWLNPPYGGNGNNKLEKWVRKAHGEGKRPDCSIVMLVPARTNTNWWHDCCMDSAEIILIRGRPKFGDAKHGLPQPLALVHFNGVVERKLMTFNLATGEIY